MKSCTLCKQQKTIDEFPVRDKATGRRSSWCKLCTVSYMAAHYKANKTAHNASGARYRLLNQEAIAEQRRRYRLENAAVIASRKALYQSENTARLSAKSREWHSANKDRAASYSRVYRSQNKEAIATNTKSWKASHPEVVRAHNQNRRAQKRERGGRLSANIVAKLFELQDGKCACCEAVLGDDYHLDHRMPLALGGEHRDDNMQLLTAKCNMRKGAKHPDHFMPERAAPTVLV